MNFIIDENIPVELIPWLNNKGHKTFSCAKASSDEKVARLAKERKAIIISQDRHFANALRFAPNDFFGIIRIKIHPPFIEDLAFSLEELFKTFRKPTDFEGKLIILEKDGFFRLRR